MLRELSYEDFLDWQAFDKIEPIGGKRGDWQAAAIISTLVNLQLARNRSKKTFAPHDFLLEWKEVVGPMTERAMPEVVKSSRQSWQAMKSIGMMIAAMDQADRDKKKAREDKQRLKAQKKRSRNG